MKTKFRKGEFRNLTFSQDGKNVRSYELARKMLPVMIAWAKAKIPPQTYGTLAKEIGHNTAQIGHQLFIADKILYDLEQEAQISIPELNGMIVNKKAKVPGDGFVYVYNEYNDFDDERERQIKELNQDAYDYSDWDDVLDMLDLPHISIDIKKYK